MKGLFVKDFLLMKMQWRFFGLVAALALIMGFSLNNNSFVLGYITFVIPIFSLSTMSYDEFDNGNAFLFTLPITRKIYVMEKYLFSLALGFSALIFGTVLSILVEFTSDKSEVLNILISAPSLLSIMVLLLSVMLPLQLKFGAEKARIAVIIICGVLFLIGLGIMKLGEALLLDLEPFFLWLKSLDHTTIFIAIIMISAIALLISIRISIKIMNKKNF